jgi:hypothetical protein
MASLRAEGEPNHITTLGNVFAGQLPHLATLGTAEADLPMNVPSIDSLQ